MELAEKDMERSVMIKIHHDNEWEPEEEFYVEIFDPSTLKRLCGNDTITVVSIIDDDKPGHIKMKNSALRVHKNEKTANVVLERVKGSSGRITVHYKTDVKPGFTHPGIPGVHF